MRIGFIVLVLSVLAIFIAAKGIMIEIDETTTNANQARQKTHVKSLTSSCMILRYGSEFPECWQKQKGKLKPLGVEASKPSTAVKEVWKNTQDRFIAEEEYSQLRLEHSLSCEKDRLVNLQTDVFCWARSKDLTLYPLTDGNQSVNKNRSDPYIPSKRIVQTWNELDCKYWCSKDPSDNDDYLNMPGYGFSSYSSN